MAERDLPGLVQSIVGIIKTTDLPSLLPDGGETFDVAVRHVILHLHEEVKRLRRDSRAMDVIRQHAPLAIERKHIPTRTEKRWALVIHLDDSWRFLGRYCWSGGKGSDSQVRTFTTRDQARRARKILRSYRDEARVVPVEVITAERGE